MGNLVETLVSLILLVVSGTALVAGLSAVDHATALSHDQTTAAMVAVSAASALQQAPYSASGYTLPSLPNPDHDPVQLTVANYAAGGFSSTAASSGLQAVTVTVTPPNGPPVAFVVYKRAP
jgi:type II secretory pathway pseudopilin PulG